MMPTSAASMGPLVGGIPQREADVRIRPQDADQFALDFDDLPAIELHERVMSQAVGAPKTADREKKETLASFHLSVPFLRLPIVDVWTSGLTPSLLHLAFQTFHADVPVMLAETDLRDQIKPRKTCAGLDGAPRSE